ncbi:BTAD domain-containing putative transcriptional regulator [Rhodococcoides kyotonense]|uniref:Predicted ATPase n=1 Tax=Rhodococcoides kyotonense TaxID=398843 RepID=A0A239HCN7_9NOCA|nr:BTAD domain-containing putative transcriptional regulator [Rhodococcus kyotonensis]SNS78563.1 Predicted ATPase [Rhodococcus kyotonensis]
MSTDQPTPSARVELRVLGPIEAFLDGRPIALGGPVPRAIVARLAIANGRMVTDDALIDDLWGDAPPRTASLTLQGYISTLRKAFEPNRGTSKPTVLVRRGPGYALVLPADGLDSTRFLQLAEAGRHALVAQDYPAADHVLGDALDLWRGPAHADCADRPFAEAEIRHLEDRRIGVFEDRMDAAITLGENVSSAAALEAHTREHPLRERAWELLALALYRAGRQGDALTALRTARENLADQLGADPRPSLSALHEKILRQDPSLDAHTAQVQDARPPARHSLVPIPLTPLVGRQDQLHAVEQAGATNRLVTLTGPGGMGKTRLALEVARRRQDSDGPWFVELADVRDGGLLVDAIATALGVTVSGGAASLVAILRDRQTLLVLDNCEQVLGPVADFVSSVLASCPGVSILATSREALGAHGEYVYDTPSMSSGATGEAVRLFVDRASPQLGGWDPGAEDLELLEKLCRALDGMPLAIELAAAQCRTLSVRQLVDNLDDRFSVLRGGPRTNLRHSTMLAAVEWSYSSLQPSESALFLDLAVFDGGFDLDAAREVTGHRGIIGDLGALIDKSLVKSSGGDPRRYRMLETLRSYAALHRDPARSAELRARHTEWVVAMAEDAYFGLRGPDCPRWMERLDHDMPNVRSALEYLDNTSETYLRIVGSLYWYWYRRGHVAEGLRYLEPAMKAKDIGIGVLVRAVAGLTITRYLAGDISGLLESFGRLAELEPRTHSDELARSDALVSLAFFEAGSGLTDQAVAHADEALALSDVIDAPYTKAEALMSAGTAFLRSGDLSRAEQLLASSAAVAEECGYQWCLASALWIHAKVDLAQQRWGGPAERKLARMIDACDDVSDTSSWMVGLATLAYALFRRNEIDSATQLLGVVDRQVEMIGYVPSAMDPIDIGRYDREIRAAVDDETLRRNIDIGRRLTRGEVRELVHVAVPPSSNGHLRDDTNMTSQP